MNSGKPHTLRRAGVGRFSKRVRSTRTNSRINFSAPAVDPNRSERVARHSNVGCRERRISWNRRGVFSIGIGRERLRSSRRVHAKAFLHPSSPRPLSRYSPAPFLSVSTSLCLFFFLCSLIVCSGRFPSLDPHAVTRTSTETSRIAMRVRGPCSLFLEPTVEPRVTRTHRCLRRYGGNRYERNSIHGLSRLASSSIHETAREISSGRPDGSDRFP